MELVVRHGTAQRVGGTITIHLAGSGDSLPAAGSEGGEFWSATGRHQSSWRRQTRRVFRESSGLADMAGASSTPRPDFAGAVHAPPVRCPDRPTLAQEEELQRLARAHKTPRKLAERAEMNLRLAAGTPVREIAANSASGRRQCGTGVPSGWPVRGLAGSGAADRRAAAGRAGGALPSRSARSWRWPARSRTSKEPALSHWSQSELAREAVRRGIVDSISHGSVGRFLKKRPTSSCIPCAAG